MPSISNVTCSHRISATVRDMLISAPVDTGLSGPTTAQRSNDGTGFQFHARPGPLLKLSRNGAGTGGGSEQVPVGAKTNPGAERTGRGRRPGASPKSIGRRRNYVASARGETGEGKKGMQGKETVGVLPLQCGAVSNTSIHG